MHVKTKERSQSQLLRKEGLSLAEIASTLRVSKASVSVWVRGIELGEEAKDRIVQKREEARTRSGLTKKLKTEESLKELKKKVHHDLSNKEVRQYSAKALCAMIYFCEGGKSHFEGVRFMNSDPRLVHMFLKLFRKSFELDEAKFRVCLHLHEYHNPSAQKKLWSRATGIPTTQFLKIYKKPNSGSRSRKDYPGCASIRYSDNHVVRELLSYSEVLFEKI